MGRDTFQMYAFDSLRWKNEFEKAVKEARREEIRELRVEIFHSTMTVVEQGQYLAGNGTVRPFKDDEMRRGTVFYSSALDASDLAPCGEKTLVNVMNEDCLVVADYLAFLGYNPVVLNMASPTNPGGGVMKGSGAQEENLFRRTNLYRSLYAFAGYAGQYGLQKQAAQYPLDRNWGGIYTPDATVFRGTESDGYPLLPHPYQMSFVAVAAVNRPELDRNGCLTPQMVALTKNKMRTILRIALLKGHDAVVMGAMGCGAFRNPPSHVAHIFHEVIDEAEFRDKLRRVVFAIIDDHNAHRAHNPEGNYQPFAREFEDSGNLHIPGDSTGFRQLIENKYAPLIIKIRSAAHTLHESVGQRYGKALPYGKHLDMVAQAAFEYGGDLCLEEQDAVPMMFAAFFHDSIEDARQTYNDTVKTALRFMPDEKARLAADIVYALSNDKGRSRAERAGDKYYKGIRETPYAPFVKFADRLANMRFSAERALQGDGHMKAVYAEELSHFIGSLIPKAGCADVRFTVPQRMIDECMRIK